MAESTTFRIVTLPKAWNGAEPDAKSTALAEKFRELRLRALKMAPEAFASKYEDESKRGLEQTLDRLSNAKATHFIALKMPASRSPPFDGHDDIERILKGQWLGMIVLLGPQEDNDPDPYPKRDPFQRMTAATREEKFLSAQDQLDAPAALHFHLNSTFVDPDAQRGGLGMALIDAAMGRAELEAAKFNAGFRVTVAVYDHNVSARKLYEKAGFRVVNKRPSLTKGPEITAVDMELSLAAAP